MALDWFNLDGKVALVTGAGAGIGTAIAKGLARAGADVLCHARSADEAAAASAAIRELGRRSLPLAADLGDRAAQDDLVARAAAGFGRIDILINNAGLIRRAPAVDYTDDDWDLLLEVNLSAPFRLARGVGKLMVAQGGGRIVNTASLLAFQGGILVPAYAASKGGIAQLTKALANEWAPKGVNVNAIAPGYIATNNTAALRADPVRSRQILERIPAGRWGEPDDIAGAAVFLCSEAARYVTGHVLAVDGGWLAR
jgi:2-dehydro-3-deoxy-D-gluconate 5-dehydrogenase